jgi:phage major head subunit gpT-like protein
MIYFLAGLVFRKLRMIYPRYQFVLWTRSAAGYGYWQMAFGSEVVLTPANFKLAHTAMTTLKDDRG